MHSNPLTGPLVLGQEPVFGQLPPGQGGYSPAPYPHPWTGNLVRHPPGYLNPPFNMFSSGFLGFQRNNWSPYPNRPFIQPIVVANIAFANGGILQGQWGSQALLDFSTNNDLDQTTQI